MPTKRINLKGVPKEVEQYCHNHGYTEPFYEDGSWWAFPPYGVMPIRLPIQQRLTFQERAENPRLFWARLIWFHGLILGGFLGVFLVNQTLAIYPSPFTIITGLYIALYGSYLVLIINRFLVDFWERVEYLRSITAGLIWFHGLILCGLFGILLIYKTIAIAPSPFAIITGLYIALYGSYLVLVINRFLLVFYDIRLSDRFVFNVFSGFSVFLCLFTGLTMFGFNPIGAFTAIVLLTFAARLFRLTA